MKITLFDARVNFFLLPKMSLTFGNETSNNNSDDDVVADGEHGLPWFIEFKVRGSSKYKFGISI